MMDSIYWVTITDRSGNTVRTRHLTLDDALTAVGACSDVAVNVEISEGAVPDELDSEQ